MTAVAVHEQPRRSGRERKTIVSVYDKAAAKKKTDEKEVRRRMMTMRKTASPTTNPWEAMFTSILRPQDAAALSESSTSRGYVILIEITLNLNTYTTLLNIITISKLALYSKHDVQTLMQAYYINALNTVQRTVSSQLSLEERSTNTSGERSLNLLL